MQLSFGARLAIGGGAALGGFATGIGIKAATGTTIDRDTFTRTLNLGGAATGIAGLALAGLGPSKFAPLGVGVGLVGLGAFIGSQLLMPHVDSPSAE
jgi:hypothetical protein